ncbi:MAG: M13 family metallopeptidase [Acidimicrobiia bacterium]
MEYVDHIDAAAFDNETPVADDFYRHVNGGWLDANPVPSEYPAWGAMFEVQVRNEEILHSLLEEAAGHPEPPGSADQMVGDYFAAGMDEARILSVGTEPLQPVLDAIADIQGIDGLRALMPRLRRLGVGALHSMGVSPDFEDPARYLVYVGQGGLGLPERDYYVRDDDRSTGLVAAYTAHVARQLTSLGRGGREESEEIVALERRLAAASLPAAEARNLDKTLNRHPVESLDELMPRFGLTSYLRDLGVTTDSVNVDHAEFFTSLEDALTTTPIETLRAYLTWHLVRTFASALPPVFEEEAFDFYNRKLGGQRQPRARWTRILAAAGADLGEQVARLYVEEAFPPEAKERCEELVDGLIAAMRRSIESLDWMTEATRASALAKVDAFTYKIGYPDTWRDYTGLVIDRGSYVGNRMRCAQFEYERQLGRLEQPVDAGEWQLAAHVVNAYYNPLHNEIVFPAGILQPPFFYPDADDAVNFGAIGTVIGHEITHGFDDNGSRFDEAGRKRDWWGEDDRSEFDKRAEVLVEQFSDFEVADDQKVNGRLTLGENIADLGGLKIAYNAFVDTLEDESELGGFTPRQRFFLSYGTIWRMNYSEEYLRMLANVDVHSPHPYRVNGPLANFPAFAEVFHIAGDSPMRLPVGEIAEIW